jgi:hypothetical protein
MADQYTWEKANQAGYTTAVTQLNRKTIADGSLLNDYVIETFSSRDQYLIDNCNKIESSANSVYSTVNSNSAENWNNAKLSGFSAFQFNDKNVVGSMRSLETLTLNFKYPFNITTATDKITIGAKNLNESYFQLAKSAGSTVSYPDISNEPPRGSNNGLAALFGANNILSDNLINNHIPNVNTLFDNSYTNSYHAVAFVSSHAGDAGFSFNNSVGNYHAGVGFNKSNNCYGGGVGINNSYATGCSIAFNNSQATGHTLAITNSTANAASLAIINSLSESMAYAAINSTAKTCGAAYINSYGANNGLGAIYSNSKNASVALINSEAQSNGFAAIYSQVSSAGIAIDNSIATNDGFAFCDSKEEGHSVAMNHSYASNGSFAYFSSSAGNGSYASHNSTAYAGAAAIFSSSATNGSFAVLSSEASNGSIAARNSFAKNGCVAYNNSYSRYSTLRSIALHDSINNAFNGAYAEFYTPNNWFTEHNLLSYNSTLTSYTVQFTESPYVTGAPDASYVGHNLVSYDSTGAGFGGQCVMYSSRISGYVGESIAMFGSTIDATGKFDKETLTTNNAYGLRMYADGVKVCNFHKYIVALYGSNVNLPQKKTIESVDDIIDSAIFLWSNAVILEPYNTINKFRIVSNYDGDVKPVDVFINNHSSQREYSYYNYRNVLYVGV